MDEQDRKKLDAAVGAIKDQVEIIRALADYEQGKFNDMPEDLQQGPRGEAIELAATDLEQLADIIGDACEELTFYVARG